MRYGLLAVLLVVTAPTLSAQAARIVKPGSPTTTLPASTAPATSATPGDTTAGSAAAGTPTATAAPAKPDAYQERELARLRRRTGTPTTAPVPDRPVQGRSLITADGGFRVVIETDAPEYRADEDGTTDPMFFRVISDVDGYVTIVSGGTGPALSVIAPNDLIAQLPIRAGEPLDFPLREWLVQGIDIHPQMPPGVEISQQSLIAVVTRSPIPLPLYDRSLGFATADGRAIGVRTFQNWIARLPPLERGIGQTSYVVRRS